ncbi:nucleoside-diphosphate kinase [Thermophagus xiamenensis]|uniref:Nucleoside diphosphate kinase n=1 Tax=Thermophagus xiamenensis TaxID=385682 RepID=A0A1I2EDF1_9BACT|nr:nucleoside-diphosphate kinase [Thermophagus xiamenensis]SFE90972.1 nucleoside diphosphate kinase [Thermophagus xiamenensis]
MTKGTITFTMIKPCAVKDNYIGDILSVIEKAGFKIIALKMLHLSEKKARLFYAEHQGKSFFNELVEFISSGPVVAAILEKENAVQDFRKLIGATDPKEAAEGTIRKMFAKDKGHNAIHGSDSDASAEREARFFFNELEVFL